MNAFRPGTTPMSGNSPVKSKPRRKEELYGPAKLHHGNDDSIQRRIVHPDLDINLTTFLAAGAAVVSAAVVPVPFILNASTSRIATRVAGLHRGVHAIAGAIAALQAG